MSVQLTSTCDLKRTLCFWDLMGSAIGQIIGAGIMSLTGVAIGMTGRSTPLAFMISAVMVLISWLPLTIMNTVARFRGGQYSVVNTLMGGRWSGIYVMLFIACNVSLSMYCLSFADYALPFLPWFGRKSIAMGVLLIFYCLNCLGIDAFAKVQNIIVVTLIISLSVFSFYGITRLEPNYLAPDTFMTGGLLGLLQTSALLTFATGGAQVMADLSGEAKNPTRDIPRAMIASTLLVAILYAFMSLVASGVLPISETANKPLTLVAKKVLPNNLYLLFIIGGAWAALISTLNNQFASATKPVMQACNDGWFPNSAAWLHPKFKTPIILLTLFLIVGAVPIIFNLDIAAVSKTTTCLGGVRSSLVALSFLNIGKVLPKAWRKSIFHISDSKVKIITSAAVIIFVMQIILLGIDLPPVILALNIIVFCLAVVYSVWRWCSGKVKCVDSCEVE